MKKLIYISLLFSVFFHFTGFKAQAIKHNVNVGNFYFTPSSLNVSVGDTIRWVLVGGSHTTTSSTIPAGATPWDSPITSAVTFYEYKVTVAGLYNYVCTPHATMGQVATFTASAAAPTLSVSPSSRSVTSAAGSTSFTVSSNSNWTSSSNSAWCTVTTAGSGNGMITANYTENTSVTPRTASITIMVSGLPSQTVTVSQSGAAPILSVNPDNQTVNELAGVASYSISSNTGWSATSSETWCTVTTSGNGNGMLSANYEQNQTYMLRTASITISVAGLAPKVVTLTQDASTVGVSDVLADEIKVLPNPTSGIFKISGGFSYNQKLSVMILDLSGKSVLSKNCHGSDSYTFDLSKSPRGFYYVRIDSEKMSIVKRVVLID